MRLAQLAILVGLTGCVQVRPSLTVQRVPAAAAPLTVPPALRTRAEASNYAETTRYAEVVAFVDAVVRTGPRLRQTTMGVTTEGRALPLVVWGDVAAATPEAVRAARAAGKAVVYVQGNIHAGEVEGKEAVLELLRDLAAGAHAGLADRLVVLFAPIYNADGNERVSLYNRPLQLGPVAGMGQRPNAQGLDLNRDMTKLASPEARALVRLLNDYAPDVLVDLHTTNGSHHGYHLTYSPGLHPSTPAPITAFLRGTLFPEVTRQVRASDGWELYYYGNLGEGPGPARSWASFDPRARFVTNYAGLRGRISILSEAYSYAPFDERIRVSKRFVEEVLTVVHDRADEVRSLVDAAATAPPTAAALRSRFAAPTEATILLDDATEEPNPYTGEIMLRRAGRPRPERMPEYGAFEAAETAPAGARYLVPDSLVRVVRLLDAHGVPHAPASGRVRAERFRIDSVRVAPRPFQNATERTLAGAWTSADVDATGHQLVSASALAAVLLDPRSDDGVVAWDVLRGALDRARAYPILRVPRVP